jgi:glycosyltransferase involved in cell wall biosynthesis
MTRRLYIDLTPVCRSFRSGIGFSLEQVLKAVDEHTPLHTTYQVIGFAPFDIVHRAKTLGLKHIQLRALPLPFKVMQALYRLRLLPSIDLWLGRGTYLFYDFRRLPLGKSKSLVCIHDLTYVHYPQFCERKNLAFLKRFVPLSVRAADMVLTVSKRSKQEIIEEFGVSEQKVSVLYPPADKSFYRRTAEEMQRVSQKYDLPAEPYFLALGNSEPRKNLETLLAAYEKLGEPAGVPPLVLFGGMAWNTDSMYEHIEALKARGYRIVKPSSYVIDLDLPAIISAALAVVTPSIYEGFGIAPLQAILCQTPAIVSSNLPVNEVVGAYTINVDARDIDQLTKALHNIQSTGHRPLDVDRQAIYDVVGFEAVAARLVSVVNRLEGLSS